VPEGVPIERPPGDIGARIHRYREETGLSLSELASRAGVSKGYLWALENEESPERRRPSGNSLFRIASALGVTIADLLNTSSASDNFEVPESLRAFAEEEGLPESDVAMLARIEFRGEQPSSAEGWRFLYNAIKYSATSNL
jgi:transcriptional regulator with XRE-family HTH domain